MLCGSVLYNSHGHMQKGGKNKALVQPYYLFITVLSSVSNKAMKKAKNRPFQLLGLCGTAAVNQAT